MEGAAAVWIGLAISAVGTASAMHNASRARSDARRAERARQRQIALQNARERSKAVAMERRQRAAIEAQADATGTAQTSSAIGAIGSLRSSTAANISFADQLSSLEQQRQSALSSSSRYQGRAATAAAIGNLPTQFGFSPQASLQQLFGAPSTSMSAPMPIPTQTTTPQF